MNQFEQDVINRAAVKLASYMKNYYLDAEEAIKEATLKDSLLHASGLALGALAPTAVGAGVGGVLGGLNGMREGHPGFIQGAKGGAMLGGVLGGALGGYHLGKNLPKSLYHNFNAEPDAVMQTIPLW